MMIYAAMIQAAPGKAAEGAGLMTKLRDAVAAASGQEAWAWSLVAGAPIGAFMISTRVDGTAGLIDLQQKLAGDSTYQKLATSGSGVWAAPAETSLARIVGGSGEQGAPKPVITVTRATIAGGHVAEAMAWANKVLNHVTKETGMGGVLTTSAAGPMFQISFLFGSDNGGQLDEATEKLAADEAYAKLVDSGGHLFVDGSAERAVIAMMP